MIGADGLVYPCCGIQYARKGIKRDLNSSMGDDLNKIMKEQLNFDGSYCDICYYDKYNQLLGQLIDPIEHVEWV